MRAVAALLLAANLLTAAPLPKEMRGDPIAGRYRLVAVDAANYFSLYDDAGWPTIWTISGDSVRSGRGEAWSCWVGDRTGPATVFGQPVTRFGNVLILRDERGSVYTLFRQ